MRGRKAIKEAAKKQWDKMENICKELGITGTLVEVGAITSTHEIVINKPKGRFKVKAKEIK